MIFQLLDVLHALLLFLSFSCSYHKQLNGDLKCITFVVRAVHEIMNSLPSHCVYCVPLFYICGYCCVQTIALLKVKDI